jgi:hypothetical protein
MNAKVNWLHEVKEEEATAIVTVEEKSPCVNLQDPVVSHLATQESKL